MLRLNKITMYIALYRVSHKKSGRIGKQNKRRESTKKKSEKWRRKGEKGEKEMKMEGKI